LVSKEKGADMPKGAMDVLTEGQTLNKTVTVMVGGQPFQIGKVGIGLGFKAGGILIKALTAEKSIEIAKKLQEKQGQTDVEDIVTIAEHIPEKELHQAIALYLGTTYEFSEKNVGVPEFMAIVAAFLETNDSESLLKNLFRIMANLTKAFKGSNLQKGPQT
jgi:hypothetical protein